MSWFSVDKNGTERISPNEPERWGYAKRKGLNGRWEYEEIANSWELKNIELSFWSDNEILNMYDFIEYSQTLTEGTIEKLIGRKLTWEDEPVEY